MKQGLDGRAPHRCRREARKPLPHPGLRPRTERLIPGMWIALLTLDSGPSSGSNHENERKGDPT